MATRIWWIVHKDLVSECRARQAWPQMLLFGFIVAFLLSYQTVQDPTQQQQTAASLCWLTICLAAALTLSQTIEQERGDGCWEALRLYPMSPQTVYFAKMAVNVLLLAAFQLVVVPFFAIVCNTEWLDYPARLLSILALGNLGVASAGTLLGAISSGARQSQSLLALLLLPLLIPVILGASEATRLIDQAQESSAWWHWVQLLGAFTTIYVTAGWILFEFVAEES